MTRATQEEQRALSEIREDWLYIGCWAHNECNFDEMTFEWTENTKRNTYPCAQREKGVAWCSLNVCILIDFCQVFGQRSLSREGFLFQLTAAAFGGWGECMPIF